MPSHLMSITGTSHYVKVNEANPEAGRGCEKLKIPYFLNIRLRDGGEVVSLARRPRFTPQEDSWYSFS
jgi:hypothetical protein